MKLKVVCMQPKIWRDVTSEIEIDPKKTAFAIVDMQNDFCSKGGLLDTKGVDMTRVRKIIDPVKKVLDASRKIRIKIVYTQHQHRPDLSDAGKEWPKWHSRPGDVPLGTKIGPPGKKLGVLIRGTWNADIIDEIRPQENDIIVEKYRYSGFYNTTLEMILKNLGIDTLMFAGVSTPTCVESTLRDAFFRDFRVILLRDCAAAFFDDMQAASEKWVKLMAGYVTSSVEVVEAINKALSA